MADNPSELKKKREKSDGQLTVASSKKEWMRSAIKSQRR